ncbi:MAG TPA: type IV toxin-antitoxin system AbiEi family antitoxin domain-containing protein [Acidimicrobiales bacterium]|nr:type IV toxin-antitoxin system AbiEi family antitoxin domain-containing protein [Acidimicrobiales bacterium]
MEVDRKLQELARDQYGVFTYAQALGLGATASAIKHRLRGGAWDSLAEGVYRLPGVPESWRQRLLALVFAAGPDAAASHRSAAALLGVPGFGPGPLEVSTPRPRRHRNPSAIVHRSRAFPPGHLTMIDGIRTTRVARTLVDLAAVLPSSRTERAVENCLSAGLVTVSGLRAMTDELGRRGRTGITLMRELLEARGDGYVASASELEARFSRLIASAGLPPPVRQAQLGTDQAWVGRVDFAYPEAKLVVELDSRRYHSSKLDFDADRARDNLLVAEGWRVVRITWAHLHDDPAAVVALIGRALRSGDAQGRQSDLECHQNGERTTGRRPGGGDPRGCRRW